MYFLQRELEQINMRPARFERATPGFVDRYSIQLSYGRIVRTKHLLLKTSAAQ